MQIFSLTCNVIFNNSPVNFVCPIIVDNELYSRCVDRYDSGLDYFPNTDIPTIISFINSSFLDKSDAWRNFSSPFSPYAGIDTFNFFQQIFPNIYTAPDGFCPSASEASKEYRPIYYKEKIIPLLYLLATSPPSEFSVVPQLEKEYWNSNFVESLGYRLTGISSEPFRRHVQTRGTILKESQIVNGNVDLTQDAVIGIYNLSLDKERVEGELGVSIGFFTSTVYSDGISFWSGVTPDTPTPPVPTPDPSGPGGGGGTLDDTSDPIPFPELPALTSTATGMMNLYTPTVFQLRTLSNYMWSDEFNLDTFKKLFADPMDVIIGLSIVPVRPTVGATETIKIGLVDTGVECNTVENQYVTVDCGSLNIKEFFGTALDYSPYTKFSIYLPFIGTKELKTDDIMGKTISIRYTVDVLSGACTAHIKCNDSVMYQYSGSCAATIPITSQNWSQLITSIIQLAGAGLATAMSGGAAAPLLPAAANTVLSAKPTIQRAGAVSGAAGFLGIQYPYLIWEHPRQSLPVGYNRFVGYPSNITQELSAVTGFTQVESIHLENIPATQNELVEIESLLKEGVIF